MATAGPRPSLTDAARRCLLPCPYRMVGHSGQGPAVVIVDDDAEPFVRKGRNVFHGFALACDPWLAPGEPCLIANQAGEFLGHGVSSARRRTRLPQQRHRRQNTGRCSSLNRNHAVKGFMRRLDHP